MSADQEVLNPTLRKGGEGWARVVKHRKSGIVWLAADERPAFDGTPVAGLKISILRFNREIGLDNEVHDSFILKAHGDGVILSGGKEFNVVQRFALGFFKAVKAAARVAADGGFTAPGDDGFGQGRKPPSRFGGFARGLRAVGRAFTLNGSHDRLS